MFKSERYPTDEAASAAAAELASRLLAQQKETPVLLLISGGSSLQPLALLDPAACAGNCTVTALDDRFSTDPDSNNFLQFRAMPVYRSLEKNGCPMLSTAPVAGETLAQYADRLDAALHGWVSGNPDGVVIALMGIGSDGHTAGIMRYPEDPDFFSRAFVETDRFVVGYDATGKNPYPLRATVTVPFLLDAVDHAVVTVLGEAKRDALSRIASPEGTLADTPGRVIREMGDVVVFTDLDIRPAPAEQ